MRCGDYIVGLLGVVVRLLGMAETESLSAVPVGFLGVAVTGGLLGVSLRFFSMAVELLGVATTQGLSQ